MNADPWINTQAPNNLEPLVVHNLAMEPKPPLIVGVLQQGDDVAANLSTDWTQIVATGGPLLVALVVVILNGWWSDRRQLAQHQLDRRARATEWRRQLTFDVYLKYERLLQDLDLDDPPADQGETLAERCERLSDDLWAETDKLMLLLPATRDEIFETTEECIGYGEGVVADKRPSVNHEEHFGRRRRVTDAVQAALHS